MGQTSVADDPRNFRGRAIRLPVALSGRRAASSANRVGAMRYGGLNRWKGPAADTNLGAFAAAAERAKPSGLGRARAVQVRSCAQSREHAALDGAVQRE